VIQVGGQIKYLFLHFRPYLECLGIGVLIQLANVECAFALIADFYFYEFRSAALKNAAIGNCGSRWIRLNRGNKKPRAS
jgi:hypothetical protein